MNILTSEAIIEKWKSGHFVEWRELTTAGKRNWLCACLFVTGLPLGTIPNGNYTIDGSEVNSQAHLYCLLGEIFFGYKGYFGQDLDGLDDCFSGLKILGNTSLVVKNHESMENAFNKKIDTYFSMLVDIFEEHGFTVRLE